MPDWLSSPFASDADVRLGTIVARLVAAYLLGCVVAGIYRVTHGRGKVEGGGPPMSLMATLVLLTVLLAMTTVVIGNNVARAFSIVGALSIVRFRTVVADTRDTAFVIFAVGVGMAVGAGYLKVPLVAIPIVAFGALVFRPRLDGAAPATGGTEFELTVSVGAGFGDEARLLGPMTKYTMGRKLEALRTVRQGAALERTYQVWLREESGAGGLVGELNGVEGVQGVEITRA